MLTMAKEEKLPGREAMSEERDIVREFRDHIGDPRKMEVTRRLIEGHTSEAD
jgi:hypothetical protein